MYDPYEVELSKKGETKSAVVSLKRKAEDSAGKEPAAKRQRTAGPESKREMAAGDLSNDAESRLMKALLLRPVQKGSPPIRVGERGYLWQGPFDITVDAERYRYRHTLDRLQKLKRWGVHVLPLEQVMSRVIVRWRRVRFMLYRV